MLEYIIVTLIVATVVALGIRSLYRTIKGQGSQCACASKGSCHSKGSCSDPQLTRIQVP